MNAPLLPPDVPALPSVIRGRHYTSSHKNLDLSDTIYEDCHFDSCTGRVPAVRPAIRQLPVRCESL